MGQIRVKERTVVWEIVGFFYFESLDFDHVHINKVKLLLRRKDISKAIQLQMKMALDYERLRKCSTSFLQYLFEVWT